MPQRSSQADHVIGKERSVTHGLPPQRVDQGETLLALDHQPSARVLAVKVTKLVGLIVERSVDFVANAGGQREVRIDAPLILQKAARVVAERLAIRSVLGLLRVGD